MFYKAVGYCRVGEVIERYHCIGLVREGYLAGVSPYMLLAFQVFGLALRGGYSVGLILRRSEGVRVGHVPGSARSVLAN